MKLQHFKYIKYDWNIIVCYDVVSSDKPYIQSMLHTIHLSKKQIKSALDTLNYFNQAFTCTNFNTKTSLVSISRCSSPNEFINSIVHETKHIVEDICTRYKISLHGEESAYMIGEINAIMFDIYKNYVCTC